MRTSALQDPTYRDTSKGRQSRKSGTGFRIALWLLGFALILFIALLKSYTASDFGSDSLLLIYTICVTTFEISRIAAAFLFKSTHKSMLKLYDEEIYEPTVSFVVPCKNEEASIEKTVRKCFEADWPSEKLEVIVINDGSTDGTIDILRRLEPEFERLTVVDWKVNRGKRHGMAEGFRRSTGEIIVQLDSDSYIVPETFPKFIEPFRKPRVGAVCAHADPENADQNLLTKMQAAYYFMSFRILKAAESTFMSVFCCSGCSSAYRREAVMPILDEWLNEEFLGKPVTWGDDRALTNWVLKLGYSTVYTEEARAYTICPTDFRTFLKQQVRWKKGWFVNSITAAKFLVRREPFVGFTYFYPLILITLVTPFMALRAFLWNPIFLGITPIFYIIGVYTIAALMVVVYRLMERENKYWPYIFVWSSVNMVFLSFVLFYALATIQNRKWGTR